MGLLDGQHRDLDRASVLATELGLKATAAATILERILRNPLVSSTLNDAATQVRDSAAASASAAAPAASAAADETAAAASPERRSPSPSTSALRDLLERHGTPTLPLRSPRQLRQQQQQHRSHQPHRHPWSAAVRTPAHPDADLSSRLHGGVGGGQATTGVPSPPHRPVFPLTPPPFSLSPHRASASPACVPDGYDNDNGCDDGSITFAEELVVHPEADDNAAASSRRRRQPASAASTQSSASPEAEEWIDTAFPLPPSPLGDAAAAAAATTTTTAATTTAAAAPVSPPLPSSTPTPRGEQPAGSPEAAVPVTHDSIAPHEPPPVPPPVPPPASSGADEAWPPPPPPPPLSPCLRAEAAGRSAVESAQGEAAASALRAFARAGVAAAESAGRAAVCAEEGAAVDAGVRGAQAAARLLTLWELQRERIVRSEGVDRRLILTNCAALAQAKRELRYSVGSTSARGGGGGGSGSDAGGSAASSSRTRLPCLAREGREMVERHGSSSAGSVLQSSYGSLATATAAAAAAAASACAAAVEGTDRFTATKALDVAALVGEKLKAKEWKKKTDRSRDPPRPFYVHPASGRRVWDLEACLLEEARKEYRAQAGGAEHVLAARCDRCQVSYAGIPARWRCDGCGEGLAQREADRAENVAARFCAACGRDVSRAHPEKCATCGICGRLCCRPCCALSLPLSGLGYPPRMLLPVCTTCVPV